MSREFELLLIWCAGCVVVLFLTLQMTSASFIDGAYIPVGHDGFYHGRRILDAVQSGHLYQFDPRMHRPQGDWVTWPWAYDLALAKATKLGMMISGAKDPAAVLMNLPPLLGMVGVALVMAVSGSLLFPLGLTALAVACFALHSVTQSQFGVGFLDHHGCEQLATLLTLWLSMRWLQAPSKVLRAALLGLACGAVLGIHAGLFILQLPLLGALLLHWFRGEAPPARAAAYFACGLIAGTLAVLLPADTFWQGRFVIYYLSWLHLYIAGATAAVVVFISRVPYSKQGLWRLLAFLVVLALPLASMYGFSSGFLSGRLAAIKHIDEIQSPYAIARQPNGLRRINQVYTLLVWVVPLMVVASLVMAWRERRAALTCFWLASALWLALLLLQLRFCSFGVTFLYLTPIVLAFRATQQWPQRRVAIIALTMACLAGAYYPTVRHQLFGEHVPAMDEQFSTLRPILPVLRKACAEDPGLVLGEPGEGHLVRYFTDCTVISNNFRLTPLDIQKINESIDLIGRPLEEVRRRAPQVKYVIARLVRPNESENPVLFHQLFAMQAPRAAGVEPLVELAVTHPDGQTEKFLGLYRLSGATPDGTGH